MPIKPPVVTEMDLVRGRQIVNSLRPLKRLSSVDAELVARTIAEVRAEGRKQGLDKAFGLALISQRNQAFRLGEREESQHQARINRAHE